MRDSSPSSPRIIGVDDWALRKGHTYGTIIVYLERSEVLELLSGRDGGESKRWLGDHPEVEVLSRDRWAHEWVTIHRFLAYFNLPASCSGIVDTGV